MTTLEYSLQIDNILHVSSNFKVNSLAYNNLNVQGKLELNPIQVCSKAAYLKAAFKDLVTGRTQSEHQKSSSLKQPFKLKSDHMLNCNTGKRTCIPVPKGLKYLGVFFRIPLEWKKNS